MVIINIFNNKEEVGYLWVLEEYSVYLFEIRIFLVRFIIFVDFIFVDLMVNNY